MSDGVFTEPMKDSLQENRVFLTRNLSDLPGIMDYLVQKGVFPDSEDILQGNDKRKDQVRSLVDRLVKRPASDYWHFVSCLYSDDIKQGHVAKKILSVYEQKGGIIRPEISRLRQDYLDRHQLDNQAAGEPPRPPSYQPPGMPDGEFSLFPNHPRPQGASSGLSRSESGNVLSHDTQSLELQAAQQQSLQERMETDAGGQPPGAQALHTGYADVETTYCRARRENPDKVYKMESNPRGHALIIDNETFETLDHRGGTTNDCRLLYEVLTFLGFDVILKKDCTAQAMLQELEAFSQMLHGKAVDACIVAILSHGTNNGIIFGTDGKVDNSCPEVGTFITNVQMWDYFSAVRCPAMSGKPCLFIVQACRGVMEDTARGVIPVARDVCVENSQFCRTEAVNWDRATIYPTVEGMVGYRHTLIPEIYEVFKQHAATLPFKDLMTEINNGVGRLCFGNKLFVACEYSCNLRKTWYFNPPSNAS